MAQHIPVNTLSDLVGFGDSYVQEGDHVFVKKEGCQFFYTTTPPFAADGTSVVKAGRLTGFWVRQGTVNTSSSGILQIGNKASGGSIGSAASTVDVAAAIAIAQTTSGQTLTLPTPTQSGVAHQLAILNTGTVAFTMASVSVAAGGGILVEWNGTAWVSI